MCVTWFKAESTDAEADAPATATQLVTASACACFVCGCLTVCVVYASALSCTGTVGYGRLCRAASRHARVCPLPSLQPLLKRRGVAGEEARRALQAATAAADTRALRGRRSREALFQTVTALCVVPALTVEAWTARLWYVKCVH